MRRSFKFHKHKVTHVGHVFGTDGLRPSPDQVQVILTQFSQGGLNRIQNRFIFGRIRRTPPFSSIALKFGVFTGEI